jgi:hypothetical protein
MRLVFVSLLLAFVAGCNTESADTGSPKNVASGPVANWQAYNSTDKTFVVEFPSTPEPWETEFDSPDYGHTDVYHVSTEFDGAMYGVNFNDYPRVLTDAEATSELKNAYTLPDTGGEVLATTEIEMANIQAIEVVSKTGPVYMVGRFFISNGRRLYSLQVGSPRDLREDRKLVDRFFQSFQLVELADASSVSEAD